MSLAARFAALLAAVCVIALAQAVAQAQPSQQSLVEAWEKVQRGDPETLAFEKIGERRYRFKTARFPFDGELKILKATVDDSTGDFEYGSVEGVVEYDLVGLSEEVVEKYEHSYESWQENNRLYFDEESSSWLSAERHRAGTLARLKAATRAREEEARAAERAKAVAQKPDRKTVILNVAVWWGPAVLLLCFLAWLMKKTGIRRQREYMNAAAVHMQNVEGLLERIAAAVESDRKSKD